MGANEMVIGDLKSQVSVELVFVFRKRERLSLQRRILPTQGQVAYPPFWLEQRVSETHVNVNQLTGHHRDFVGRVLSSAEEAMEKRYALRLRGFDLGKVASRVSEVFGVKPEEVWAEGKYRRIVEARSLLCYRAARELGVPMSSLARKVKISIPSVSESVARGRRNAAAKGFLLET